MFGHYIAKPGVYHMYQIYCCSLIGSAESFREGLTVFRNGLDLAQQYRDEAIARANHIADALGEIENKGSRRSAKRSAPESSLSNGSGKRRRA